MAIGLLPIGIDGFSQLLSQPPFALFTFRESTWWLRLLTGSLLFLGAMFVSGYAMAWFVRRQWQ